MQLWVIQTKLKLDDASLWIADACQKLSLDWGAVPVIPFNKYIPDMKWDGPIFYYGSIRLLKNVRANKKIEKGAVLFDNEEYFKPSYYGPLLGENWLNHGSELISVRKFLKNDQKSDIFVRPDGGNKAFSGILETPHYIKSITIPSAIKNKTLKMSDKIVVSAPIPIKKEYRTWIVDGAVAAIVGYRRDDKIDPWELDRDGEEYASVERFALQQALKLLKLEAFVLDVAVTHNDEMKVVELNDVHCSGLYRKEHAVEVVAHISNYIAKYKSLIGRRA